MILFHRTSIGDAREIVKRGFVDEKWAFHVRDSDEPAKVHGVWLADRPLSEQEGPDGDAILEVHLDLAEESLERFEMEGIFWDARLWVVPAELLNPHATIRIGGVDPRSSWFFDTPAAEEGDADAEGDDADEWPDA